MIQKSYKNNKKKKLKKNILIYPVEIKMKKKLNKILKIKNHKNQKKIKNQNNQKLNRKWNRCDSSYKRTLFNKILLIIFLTRNQIIIIFKQISKRNLKNSIFNIKIKRKFLIIFWILFKILIKKINFL